MMEKNVFSKDAFKSGAEKDFILVKIDIPNGDKKLKAKNQKVLEKYHVSGVPTVVPNIPETAPVLFKIPLMVFPYALF